MAKAPTGEPPSNPMVRSPESPEGITVIDVPIVLGQQIDVTSPDGKIGFKGTIKLFPELQYLVDGQLSYDENGEQKGSAIYHYMSFTYLGRDIPGEPDRYEFTVNKYPNSPHPVIRLAYQEGGEIRFQVMKQPEQPSRLSPGSPVFHI